MPKKYYVTAVRDINHKYIVVGGKKKGKRKKNGMALGIRFLRGIQGKKDGRKEGKRMEECSFSVFQGGLSLSRRKKKSSGFKGRRRERRKRKCLAWRMGFLGAG